MFWKLSTAACLFRDLNTIGVLAVASGLVRLIHGYCVSR
jgi:hypothetical protein